MTIKTDDYTVGYNSQENRGTLSGILRLASPASYDDAFGELKAALENNEQPLTIDMAAVTFMNSSGITALSRLVISARALNRPLILVGNAAVPWQKKTIPSLKKLYEKLEIRIT